MPPKRRQFSEQVNPQQPALELPEIDMLIRGPEPPREHKKIPMGIGEMALPKEEIQQPELKLKLNAGSTEGDYLKLEYHNLKPEDFRDLSDADFRELKPLLDRDVLKSYLYFPYKNRISHYLWESAKGKSSYFIAVSKQEAFHLGIARPLLLGERAITAALSHEWSLPLLASRRDAPPRWEVINSYKHHSVIERRHILEDLYDTTRSRNSNGSRKMRCKAQYDILVENADKVVLMQEARLKVFHPVIRMIAENQGWDDARTRKMLQVWDWRAFVDGSLDQQKEFVKSWIKETRIYLQKLEDVCEDRLLLARREPSHRDFLEVVRIAVAKAADFSSRI